MVEIAALRAHLLAGQVLPAHPLALTAERKFDERYQRALTRYYVHAGAGGIAVGVHTTQFAIRSPRHGLYAPVLELASRTADDILRGSPRSFIKVAGILGNTAEALDEARVALGFGYHTGLLSLGAWKDRSEREMLQHCREVAAVIPLFGFYLQPAVGGRVLSYSFWREFVEIENVVAIKIAPFNRYQTLDVVRAVSDSQRSDVALYTGNDDSIIVDLLTPFSFGRGSEPAASIVGGLLGQWAVWTRRAVEILDQVRLERATAPGPPNSPRVEDSGWRDIGWLRLAAELTDANSAIFDVCNNFAGCIAGIHEVLRRQGLMRGIWCLDPKEALSAGQMEEIDRVLRAYPELADDAFVAENLEAWLRV
ncbi:MAG: dihydrodipicolinate synthase family protein [Gemmatimonadaceae bacterium]